MSHGGVFDGNFEPSAWVAVIGADQLARMTHQAAIDYGIAIHVLADSATDPAVIAGATHTVGNPDCYRDLLAAAGHGQVVTFNHELVPTAHLHRLEEAGFQLRPHAEALAFTQDKLYVRRFLGKLGDLSVPVPAFAPANTTADVIAFAAEYGWPVLLKARGYGYDSQGAHILTEPDDADLFLPDTASLSEPAWVLEEYLDHAVEFAILVARRSSGYLISYSPISIRQETGIYREFTMPAEVPTNIVIDATRVAESIVAGLDATGICTVKFFWASDGRLLFDQLILRPHDSGNVTIEACATSQFHQHLRAILDWPLGPVTLRGPAATVTLLGGLHRLDLATRLPAALDIPGTQVHLYAKIPHPGEQFGHVTALGPSTEHALESARAAASLLTNL